MYEKENVSMNHVFFVKVSHKLLCITRTLKIQNCSIVVDGRNDYIVDLLFLES